LLLVVSCAEKKSEDLTGVKDEAFHLWMAKYHPEAEELPELGIYIQWLERSGLQQKLKIGEWMKIDYTGRLLNQNVFITRDSDIAKEVGLYENMTYYKPELRKFFPDESDEEYYDYMYNVPLGVIEMLRDKINLNDRVMIYMPPEKGYTHGYSAMTGYSSSSVAADAFSYVAMDVKLTEIIKDIEAYEKTQLSNYVINEMGLTMADSIAKGMYRVKTLAIPTAPEISETDLVSVFYTGRLVDGFIFDTNDENVAVENGIYSKDNTYGYLSFYGTSSEFVSGFTKAILNMRYGEKATVIFSSDLGYGAAGTSDGKVPPYSPLIFDLYVLGAD